MDATSLTDILGVVEPPFPGRYPYEAKRWPSAMAVSYDAGRGVRLSNYYFCREGMQAALAVWSRLQPEDLPLLSVSSATYLVEGFDGEADCAALLRAAALTWLELEQEHRP